MKILYDHQAFSMQDYGGISRYFVELAKRLSSIKETETNFSMIFSNNEHIEESEHISARRFFKKVRFKGKRRLMTLINTANSSLVLFRNEFDIFHATYYDTYYLSLPRKKPLVITCHDLIHEKFLQFDKKTIANKKATLQSADKVIAVSENTKRDLQEYYSVPSEKIQVIYSASSLALNNVQQYTRPLTTRDYFLYVGNRNAYKNFKLFITAIAPALTKYDLEVICAGGGPFDKDELTVLKKFNLLNRVKQAPATDTLLIGLYLNAIALFYPSLYEGFGIPILEAMACNCAVATSNISSIPEVAGEAALYFDPSSPDSMLYAAETLLNGSIRSDLKIKGLEQVRKFSWDKTTSETYLVYQDLL
jgi:glycosyltransferase involved in cell wall biosynthesis